MRRELGEHGGAPYLTSSYTDPGNCVAVARPKRGTVGVKDSKDPHGPALEFERSEWSAFLELAKTFEV